MPELRLDGCRPRPLIAYLKALGVLRVVAEQADPGAALRWHAGAAELRCALERHELVGFFLDRYRPTPVLSPWNGSSGFFPKDDSTALDTIASADPTRFGAWHAAIAVARGALDELGLLEKPSSKAVKLALLWRLRAWWDDDAIRWLDAAVVLRADGPSFPPLLGSGGNDGHYDIANNYAQSVARALGLAAGRGPDRRAEWLDGALLDTPATMVDGSLAHFDRQKSPVNTPEGEADGFANPWDLVLAVEGCLAMSAGATRRDGQRAALQRHRRRSQPRGPRPATGPRCPGRRDAPSCGSRCGRLGRPPRSSTRFCGKGARRSDAKLRAAVLTSRAPRPSWVSRVARGISAFERYAVLERAGQAHLALAAGRVEVRSRPAVRLLDGIQLADVPSLPRLGAYGASRRAVSTAGDVLSCSRERTPWDRRAGLTRSLKWFGTLMVWTTKHQ